MSLLQFLSSFPSHSSLPLLPPSFSFPSLLPSFSVLFQGVDIDGVGDLPLSTIYTERGRKGPGLYRLDILDLLLSD